MWLAPPCQAARRRALAAQPGPGPGGGTRAQRPPAPRCAEPRASPKRRLLHAACHQQQPAAAWPLLHECSRQGSLPLSGSRGQLTASHVQVSAGTGAQYNASPQQASPTRRPGTSEAAEQRAQQRLADLKQRLRLSPAEVPACACTLASAWCAQRVWAALLALCAEQDLSCSLLWHCHVTAAVTAS